MNTHLKTNTPFKLIGTSTSKQTVIEAITEAKNSLTRHAFRAYLDDLETLATVVAASHRYACDCAYCFIFFSVTGDYDETGPFKLDELNDYRQATGRKPFPAPAGPDYDTRSTEGQE
jgi:hypothetical protein